MIEGVLLGLGAATGYGLGDFLAGVWSRRVGIVPVLVVGQLAGLVVLAGAVALFTPAPAALADLALGAVAGLAAAGGSLLLLRGFQTGRLSVVSPVSSLGAAGIPVAADLLLGARLSTTALAGIALALVAIWLVGSGGPAAATGRRRAAGLGFGLGAGVGFAAMYLALDATAPASGLWPAAAAQVAIVAVALAVAATPRRTLRVPPAALPGVAATGIVAALATVSFLLAARVGLVSVAAVIASLSPAVTVLLARLLLAERLPRRQLAGLLAAGAALVAIGAG